ncbi:MAG TPA: outer membrane beta-barrel protein [bacterium]|nr:outer membrane beta-barrel protein [bacterium]
MKRTLCGLMVLWMAFCASTALADYKNYDARGNFLGWVKSPYSIPPWKRTDSTAVSPSSDEPETMESTQSSNVPKTVESTDVDDSGGPWTGGLAGGLAPCATGFDASYSVGYGFEGNVGLKLNQNWAILLALDVYTFNSTFSGWSANQIDLLPTLRYSFGGQGIRPYLFAGVGGNDNLMLEPNSSVNGINLAVAGGIGIDFPVARCLDVFIQGKYDINFTLDGSFSYLPVSAGIQFN